jgi:hypothetical protein
MKVIKVVVLEYLSRIIEVEVDDSRDENDAINEVRNDYWRGSIVLDSEDFDDVDFTIYED